MRWLALPISLLLLLGGAGGDPSVAQLSSSSLDGSGAVDAVAAALEVERSLLEQSRQRYEELARRRSETAARLTRLYPLLEAAVRATEEELAQIIRYLTHTYVRP